MKKLIILFITLSFTNANAQVFISENVHDETNKPSYTVFSNQDDKDLSKNLDDFLSKNGKVNKVDKNILRLQTSKHNAISSELKYVDVIQKSTKKMEKLEFFFLDKDDNAIEEKKFNSAEAAKFVQEFVNYNNKQIEAGFIAENIANTEDELKEAEKELSKIEKSIESNYKDQAKLGKKLDASPELLAQAMAEKDDLSSQIVDGESTDSKTLSKAWKKKDKKISKLKKDAAKAETKLEAKEKELEELKEELNYAKAHVKAREKVLSSAKAMKGSLK